jgi:hypothetical protein
MNRFYALVAILFISLSGACGQSLSSSKLSAHLINAYTTGSSNIVSGRPGTLKVLGLDSGFPTGMLQAMRDYKAKVPNGKIVVRIYSPKQYTLSDDATVSAGDFWTNILQHSLNTISASDRALIDYLEGPNEGQTPTLGYPSGSALQASQWFNQFWTNLTPRIVAAGYKPCIGSIAVGNPGGSTSEMQSYLAAFVPALRQAQAAGGAWSYHAYTISYTTDVTAELYYSLRYRQFYSYFSSAFPDLASLPLILTEGGVDFSGDPNTSGWQARGTQADYQRWLNWFDHQLQQDAYVVGCTLFENGDPAGWSSFDLEPICGWLKNYLIGPASLPSPPNVSAQAGNGVITLSWTNASLTPTTWNIKRSTNSTGPWFVVAPNISEGVTATTWQDTSVTNFTTYYYVVTAVNSLGEGSNSMPVSAMPTALTQGAINCGGGAVGSFSADAYFDSGTAFLTSTPVSTNGLVAPAPMAVYQSQRYGDVTYTLPALIPNASYKLRLHFAEVYWTAANQRVFNVLVNGAVVLANFDIFAAAGTNFKGVIRECYAVADSQGRISIQLETLTDNAAINGIELQLFSASGPPAVPTNVAVSVGDAVVNLSWNAPVGATGFWVKRSTTPGGPYTAIATNITGSAYPDVSFTPNTTYYYRISATNSFGESPNSAEVSTTPTNGLPDVVVTSVTWTPANLFNGSPAVFSARVLNRGSAATPSGVSLGLGFNMDGTGTVSWASSYSSSLAPNASVILTADGGPNGFNYWSATAGPHILIATADDINRFPESLENNNSLAVPVNVFASGYAFNSGGGTAGGFLSDANWAGSANTFVVTNSINTTGAVNPAPVAVYQSERWGAFSYVLNNLVAGSNYLVRLHFAEISPSVNGPGDRRFNVLVNGTLALTDFDIFAQADGKFRAITRDVKKRADSSGSLMVDFVAGASNQPKLSGIQVMANNAVLSAPVITGISRTNSVTTIVWSASPGTIYQAQYKTDLTQTQWFTFGTNVLATGASQSASDAAGGNAQRFYRVVRLD